jgi:competence protein CoiA
MLTAKLTNGEYLSLVDSTNIEKLKNLRDKKKFYCTGCKQQVILKLGTKKRPHFSHLKNSNCHAYSEPESNYHLEGKIQLYHWLMAQRLHVELEKYLPSISQIPDLLTRVQWKEIAIEYQCSSIPEELLQKRTKGYIKQDISPIWLLGEKRLKHFSSNITQLHNMDWLIIRNLKKQFFIYTLDPFQKSLQVYSNIFPLSANQAFVTSTSFTITSISFKDLLLPRAQLLSNTLFPIWFKRKQNWRFHIFRNSSTPVHYLKTFYYNQHQHFTLFPAEVGIPTHYQPFIQTPSYAWQSWVLEFIKDRGKHRMFTFREVLLHFKQLVEQNIFQIRHLLLAEGHYSFAIMEYLNALSYIGFLKKLSSTLFVIKREVMYPKTIEEASHQDKETLEKLKGFL